MVFNRYPIEKVVESACLIEKLHFKTSNVYAKNRLMKAALSEQLCSYTPDNPKTSGLPTQSLLNLYEKWGVGGYGIILTGNIAVDHLHLEARGNLIVSVESESSERRELYEKLAKNMSAAGSLAIVQLSHAGRQTPYAINKKPFSVSDVKLNMELRGHEYGQPRALTVEEIKTEVVDRFVYAAKFMKECGFNGVQLHAAHGYLLAAFLSPTTNTRTDEYGGNVFNRTRVVREIYQAIRKEIPSESGFVVGIKLNSVEFQDGGLSNDDAVETAKILEAEGFDFIELTGGNYEKWNMVPQLRDTTHKRESFFGVFSKNIRSNLKKKSIVYLTGGFRTIGGMVRALEAGDCDGFGLGRPVTAEADIARKYLDYGIQSCAVNHFEYDFLASAGKSSVEMLQMSRTSLAEAANDPSAGIMDLSPKPAADQFATAMIEYHTQRKLKIADGEIPPEHFDYQQYASTVMEEGA
ncbi:hypothetical protein M3Y94_01215000 [Aphelenchoides besseyi]|nr:hypothetical protein M3Y94_01215000 [Aphelenchoides besseyi]KAI6228559.1 hypothetical protein M3Y95_00634900 [Aphelenchoides besseyi]